MHILKNPSAYPKIYNIAFSVSGEARKFLAGGRDLNFCFPKAIFRVKWGVKTEYTEIFLHENYIPLHRKKIFRGSAPPVPYIPSPLDT